MAATSCMHADPDSEGAQVSRASAVAFVMTEYDRNWLALFLNMPNFWCHGSLQPLSHIESAGATVLGSSTAVTVYGIV